MIVHEKKEIPHINNNSPLVIMLPFAGGNTYSYRAIIAKIKEINKNIDIVCPELPGRGSCSNEPLIKDIKELTNTIFLNWIKPLDLKRPYIIYGHSMGALNAYYLCHSIKNANLNLPIQLIVSGREGPSTIRKANKLYELPSTAFWDSVSKMGGMPKAVLENSDLKEYFEPILRSDFEAVEVHKHVAPLSLLETPIAVFYGSEDDKTFESLNLWKSETTEKLDFYELSGDHFFIFNHVDRIASHLCDALAS